MSILNTPITVGIVGLGRAGWRLHLEPISKIEGFKIVAVADPVAERTQEAADLLGCQQFSNIDELLQGSDAQLVVVATPNHLHYADIKKVLNAGRHCLGEKPISLSYKEAEEIVALAKEKNLQLFINHSHLHLPIFHYLKSVIDRGILGPIYHVQINWQGYARRWDWQTLKKNGGGNLNNTCPHIISTLLPLLGSRVKSVWADLRNIKDAGDAEDSVNVMLKTESGVTGGFNSTTAHALGGNSWTLLGKYGSLVCDGKTAKLRYYDPATAAPLEVIDAAAPGRQYLREQLTWIEATEEVPACPVPPIHVNILEVFTKGAQPVVTPESAAEVVRVTELAHQAAAE